MTQLQEDSTSALTDRIALAIRDIGIPACPTALLGINSEMAKEQPDYSHLARIVSADVSLSAALLKTTNSPFFGLGRKVRSVPEAMLVLGLKLMIQTIASLELSKAFGHEPHMDRFWDESGTVARVSGWLAMRLRRKCWTRSEEAYTFGLFHDCGIPILLAPFPDYRSVLAEANADKQRRFTDIEDNAIGVNHAELGATLAESWLLPQEMIEGIRNHHNLSALIDKDITDPLASALPLIALTQLAEHLISQRTGMGKTFEWDKSAEAVMQILKIDQSHVLELLEACHEPIAGYFG